MFFVYNLLNNATIILFCRRISGVIPRDFAGNWNGNLTALYSYVIIKPKWISCVSVSLEGICIRMRNRVSLNDFYAIVSSASETGVQMNVWEYSTCIINYLLKFNSNWKRKLWTRDVNLESSFRRASIANDSDDLIWDRTKAPSRWCRSLRTQLKKEIGTEVTYSVFIIL